MLKKIALFVAVAVIGSLAYAATLPDQLEIERSVRIAQPPSVIFPDVNSLRKWQSWSPWAKMDPNAKWNFEGPESGVGAISKWDGDDQVGQGAMAIVESVTNQRVKYRVDFVKPWPGETAAEIRLQEAGSANETLVTWRSSFKRGVFEKLMGAVFNVQGKLEQDFDNGLANLKQQAEARPQVAPPGPSQPPVGAGP